MAAKFGAHQQTGPSTGRPHAHAECITYNKLLLADGIRKQLAITAAADE
jgi:hypothetical protein